MKDLFDKLKPYFPYLLALIAGGIMPFAFAPFNMSFSPYVSLLLLFILLSKVKWKQAAWLGFWYGMGLFGIGASWIYASIHDYGYAAPWLAATITGIFIIILSLFPALQMGSMVRLFPNNSLGRACLVFPTWWVIFEIFRGCFLTGFPWLYVGYSQLENHLSAFAPIGSVFLVSFFTIVISAALYLLMDYFYFHKNNPKLRNYLFLILFGPWIIAFGITQIHFTYPTNNFINVAIVQGNIPQLLRWDPQAVSSIIRNYREATLSLSSVDLIVWPESAIPLPLPLSAKLFEDLNTQLKARNVGLLAGVPSELPDGSYYYNSIVGVGTASGIYHKHHLVPFGEFVPFERQLRGLIGFFNLPMSAFVAAPSEPLSLRMGNVRFSPAICYEIAYPFYVQSKSQSADVILTVSNDTWFGETIGPAQHMQIAECRAFENGKPLIRATNTGITALLDHEGEFIGKAPQFEATVLTGTIEIRDGQTPWTRFGPWILFGFLGAMVAIAFILKHKRRL